ncbi:MAG: ABC transporter permease [Alphaproteobacteria bacterium]|nr:ABC transporter permease [Alphaproteobacteria bacterium]
MADVTMERPVIQTADGVPLKTKLRVTTRNNRLKAFGLVIPLLAFVLIAFIFPIGSMLLRSVDNSLLPSLLPRTAAALQEWDGQGIPDEATFAIFAEEMVAARKARTIGRVATRVNFERSGMRSTFTKSARRLAKVEAGPWKEALIKIDKKWGEQGTWTTLKVLSEPLTLTHYLAALDLKYDDDLSIVSEAEDRQIYVPLFLRTLWVSLGITVLCLLLGYPIAFLMATLPVRISNLLMILVLLPFWTSLLVRTTSWIVMLQTEGVLNDIMVALGLISDESRVQMIYNMTGTVVAMTHILLPFMVLPLYSVMKTISPSYVRAARSLGATPATAFFRVYFPNTIPGIGAGSLLVFILSIGYYITPALVGGRTGQLISNLIAFHMQKSLNWGLAGALGALLLGGVLALYILYNRIVGVDNMKLG